MKTFEKCETCNADIGSDRCVFATHRRIIEGKEYFFCCTRCAEAFKKKRERKV